MNNCKDCSMEWRERYINAVQRFDRQINIAMTVTIIAICSAIISLIVTAFCVIQTIEFINQFEYVEETEYSIEQDGVGQNIAVLVDNSTVKED